MNKYLFLLFFISFDCFSENTSLCTSEELNQYGSMLKNEISSKLEYPEIAVRRRWHGSAKVTFWIVDGVVIKRNISQSTGHPILDSAMNDAIDKSNFTKLTCETINENITATIPIEFNLVFPTITLTYPSNKMP